MQKSTQQEYYFDVGQRIRNMRDRERMNQAALAAAAGVSPRVIGTWERGEVPITLFNAHILAGVFRCTLNRFEPSANEQDLRLVVDAYTRLSPEEKQIIHYILTKWPGDPHAVAYFMGLYASLFEEYRADISGMGLHMYEIAKSNHAIYDDAPPVNIPYLKSRWNGLLRPYDDGLYI